MRTNCTLDSLVKRKNTITHVIEVGFSANICRMLIRPCLNLDMRYRQSCKIHGQWDQWDTTVSSVPGSVNYQSFFSLPKTLQTVEGKAKYSCLAVLQLWICVKKHSWLPQKIC